MSRERRPAPRRILLGLSGDRELRAAVDAAVMLAAGFGARLHCVVVEHEDLLAVAGLPFARTTGAGGQSAPVTLEAVSGYFRRLAQSVERRLVERCAASAVDWKLVRPQGDYLRELMASIETGDAVVVSRRDIHGDPRALSGVFAAILEKAAAVVIPGSRPATGGSVLAIAGAPLDGQAAALARDIATATARRLEIVAPFDFQARRQRAAIVVAPVGLARLIGEASFLRMIEATAGAAVLV